MKHLIRWLASRRGIQISIVLAFLAVSAAFSSVLLVSASEQANAELLSAVDTLRAEFEAGGPSAISKSVHTARYDRKEVRAARFFHDFVETSEPHLNFDALFSRLDALQETDPTASGLATVKLDEGTFRFAWVDFRYPTTGGTLPDDIQVFIGRETPSSAERFAQRVVIAINGAMVFGILLILGLDEYYRRRLSSTLNRIGTALDLAAKGDPVSQRDFRSAPAEVTPLLKRIDDIRFDLASLLESLRTMTSVTAHELRTPLTRLKGFATQLASASSDEAVTDLRALGVKLAKDVDAILKLYEQLMIVTRAELDKGDDLPLSRVNLSELVEDACEAFEPETADAQLNFRWRVDPAIWILGDRGLLYRCLENLLGNAQKYAPAGADVSVRLDMVGSDAWELSIRNTGGGFPKDVAFDAFQPYRRSATTHHKEGIGIGLSVVAAVARRHGARLWIEASDVVAEVRMAGSRLLHYSVESSSE